VRRTLIACVVVALLVGGGTATASGLITGSDIKNGSVTGTDIKQGSLTASDLSQSLRNRLNTTVSGSPGAPGQQGAKGDTGARGPAGADGATGPQGLKGDKGEPGANGTNGADGAPGTPGAKGEPGAKGADGTNGTNGVDGAKGEKGDPGADGKDGKDGVVRPVSDSLAAPMAITNIGGPINDRYTDLGTGVTLPAGTYIVTVDAAFESAQAGDPAVEVYPQVSLWIDRDHDGLFDWKKNEGDISPNAIMPVANNRHISASGVTQVTLIEETFVGLVAHGYTSTQGSERSGEIDVVRAVVGALPVS
jgi:hypothetical protein